MSNIYAENGFFLRQKNHSVLQYFILLSIVLAYITRLLRGHSIYFVCMFMYILLRSRIRVLRLLHV